MSAHTPVGAANSQGRPEKIDDLIDSRLMARLDRLDVVSRKIFTGKIQGERRSRRRGQSVEFADFRNYSHGDDLRFVDWNIYARLDRLFLKLFLEEEDLSMVIALDLSQSMNGGSPNKFDYARRLAMALGYIGLVNNNRVSFFGFGGGKIERLTGLRGRRRTREMGSWLLDRTTVGDAGFSDGMRAIALGGQGRGVLLVLSDFLFPDGYEKGLAYVAGRGFDVYALQLLAPQEIDPARHGISGDLRLIDSETEAETEVTASTAVLAQYKAALEKYVGGLREFSVRRSISHQVVETSTDLDTLLLDYLRRRGLLA
ncbi:MAG: DUF58 domain-containing protein [Phycisphaerales bacterium]|nr:DUF58 domain-containing protein [Phycisphaerales bacterium]